MPLAAGLLRSRVSPGAPPWGPAPPPRPIPVWVQGRSRGPWPLPRRGQCQRTNVPSLPPSLPRAPFFEPDANLTLTSIIRSALSKLVVSSPLSRRPSPPPFNISHPIPDPLRGTPGRLDAPGQDQPTLTGRFAQARARTHARTRPRTQPRPTPQPALSTALHTRPRAGRPT